MERQTDIQIGRDTLKTIGRHIIPFAFILYFFNYMDRVNIGFAALQMNVDLGISSVQFGQLASVFFISYLVCQIPSNMMIQKLGARRWIGFILIAWGGVTTLLFFAQSFEHLLAARLLLGVFEAGFFPGMIYYLACWFPAKERARVTALFMMAIAVSSVVAAPMSGWIIQHANFFDHAGWRWLFAIEGIPTVLLGVLTFYVLYDRPQDAPWLTDKQKSWLVAELNTETQGQPAGNSMTFWQIVRNPILWRLSFVYMFVQAASQASNYWLPGQVKGFTSGLTDTHVGLIMAVPFLCAMFAMPLWGAHSDKQGERKFHAALPMLLAGAAFLVIATADSMSIRMFGMVLFGVGILSYYGPFWAIPSMLLSPAGLAISIAVINSCSSLGGFFANLGLGYVAKSYGSYGVFVVEAILCVISSVLLITMRIPRVKAKEAKAVTA
ncbi:MFS transporter [Limnobaculum xujianqingii]|uniref:MFS transporter n=1 Tax=Limnobaculum xujianqingii TaxID=2738837 RepID=UPI00112C8EF1|nr:MFS transporter [Limnobaculum xujianqingii]